MSGEVRIQTSLQVKSGSLSYQNQPTAFQGDMPLVPGAVVAGPSPGAVLIATGAGTDISFAQLTAPGYCRIQNLDPDTTKTKWVTYGIRDTSLGEFYPLGEMLPGESYVLRLSRHLGKEYVGTGTAGGGTTLRMVANGAPVYALVEAFNG